MKRPLLIVSLLLIIAGGLLVCQAWRKAVGMSVSAAILAVHGMGLVGLFALLGAQFLVAASGFLPASLLAVAAGATYGLALGFMMAASGVLLGAVASFSISRSVFRPCVARYLQKSARLGRFDRALARDSWRFVCMLRLSPIMPFAIASYALGLSSIEFRAYCLGTLASLPALLLYVYLGTLFKTGAHWLATGAGAWQWVVAIVGSVTTIALCWRVARIARNAMVATQDG